MTRKMRMELGLLKIGEIAREARILRSTIRHYTEVGLLKVKGVTEGGYRLYEREDTLDRLRTVKSVSEVYLSLADIKARMS